MSKLNITEKDLYKIHSEALSEFKDRAAKGLSDKEFVTKCYLDSVLSFLEVNNIKIEVEYQHEVIYNSDTLD